MKKLILFLFCILILSGSVIAAETNEEEPIGLQKIREYNQQHTEFISTKVSFAIAFIAGVLGILSPCILPFIPAYFSYTFKEKKDITKMTFTFFLGFSVVFVTMGIIAGFLGHQSILVFQKAWLMQLVGALLIGMGLLTLLGKGFSSFIKFKHKPRHDIPGVFFFGMIFALGWTACLGPILAGVLGIGAILGSPLKAGFLMFFYSLGNLAPLFLISVFYDTFNIQKSKILQGKLFKFKLDDNTYYIHSTNLISGLLFMIIGAVIFFFQGTAVVNTWDFLKTKEYFYSIQNALLESSLASVIGWSGLLIFLGIIGWYLWKQKK